MKDFICFKLNSKNWVGDPWFKQKHCNNKDNDTYTKNALRPQIVEAKFTRKTIHSSK